MKTSQQIEDNIADSQPERFSERLAEERADDLKACLKESKTFDDFCERCNKLLNKQDALAKDLWDEYREK